MRKALVLESFDTLERLYRAYQRVSSQRQRISVPIDAVIKEAGLWDSRESARQALLQNRRLLQLDEGDWASADADTRAVHLTDPIRTVNVHGYPQLRKLTMMAFTEAPQLLREPKAIAVDGWQGRSYYPCEIVGETAKRYRVRVLRDASLPGGRTAREGAVVLVPKHAVRDLSVSERLRESQRGLER
jgi:hypothetical protein